MPLILRVERVIKSAIVDATCGDMDSGVKVWDAVQRGLIRFITGLCRWGLC